MKKNILVFLFAAGIVLLSSCKKTFDLPPKKAEPANSGSITIDSIYKKYESYYLSGNPSTYFRFPDDVNLTCTVTADEISGNIYKSVFVQDATGAMEVKLINAGGLYAGDLIRINLKGVVLDDYAKMVQLDSIDIERRVVKVSTGNIVTATKSTFNEIMALNSFGLSKFQSKLVLLDSVEFDIASKNQLYSDPVYRTNVDRTLVNSTGKSVTVRTSGYANFAGNTIPCGKGSIVAVVSQYNTDIQLTIRDFKEVKLTGGNCPYFAKNFEDISLTSGGWTTYNVNGTVNWTIGTIGGNYANISNYPSNAACETWLISPAMDLSGANNPVLSFKSAYNYGPASSQLSAYISTNYISGNPSAATWTVLNPVLSAGNWLWTPSGSVSLGAYKSSNVHVGFKYLTPAISANTWQIDDIGVVEQ